MSRPLVPAVFLFLLSSSFWSCGPDYLFQKEVTLAGDQWSYVDTLNFDVEVQNIDRLYNIFLDVEHAVDFPRQNMYIKIHTGFPDGQRQSELVSLELANKAGVWYGRCGSDWCNLRIPLQMGAFFDQQGAYQLTLEQYTRLNPLPGVRTLALNIERTDQQRTPQK